MKIKTKKQLNLPQLIEYIFANNLKHKWKDSDNTGGYIHVYDDGKISVDKCTVDSTFTVEVKEEITEDMVIPILIARRDFDNGLAYSRYEYIRIKDIKDENSTLIYVENDDKSLTLIWRDGRLIE